MLLTITYRQAPATDLGYLLHKNPARPQVFEMSFGRVYIFYPRAESGECTAALLLDLDPVDLARGKAGGGLFDYINDRPYAASSFLSTALARVYGSAMSGACRERPELYAVMAARMLWQPDYGRNLDALYDLLTGLPHLGQRFAVRLPAEDAPCRGYAEIITQVMEDAGTEVRILE